MSSPAHERGGAVDEKIFKAAIDLLAARGTMNLSIADIAKEAGVNKTTVYRRHKKIESIVLSAVSLYAEQEIPIPDTGSLLEDFKELARSVSLLLDSSVARALVHATGTNSLSQLRRDYWSLRLAKAAAMIERASQRGECSTVTNPHEWIESLVAPIHFRIFQTQGTVSTDFLNQQARRVFANILADFPPRD